MLALSNILILTLLIEASVQLTKSQIFNLILNFILKISSFNSRLNEQVTYLLFCGYCKSVWFSTMWVTFFYLTGCLIPIVTIVYVNFIVTIIVTHRLSNVLHFCIDTLDNKRGT